MYCRGLLIAITLCATPARATPEMGALKIGRDARALVTLEGIPLSGFGSGGRRKLLPHSEGYTYFLKPSEGVADPVRVKSVALQVADGAPLVWVSMDIVGTSASLADTVASRLADVGVTRQRFWLNATHTHSGPGAVIDAPFWEFLAADRLHEDVLEAVTANLIASARAALADLKPAHFGMNTVQVPGLTTNRRHTGAAVDNELLLLKFVSPDQTPLAAIVHFAIHGTCYGSSNLLLSADNQGYFERALETALPGAVALFANAAQGDVDPIRKEQAGAQAIGTTLASAAASAWASTPTHAEVTLEVVGQHRSLPDISMNLATCDPTMQEMLETWVVSMPGPLAETSELFSAMRLDDAVFMSVPGEAITMLGEQLKAAALDRGFHQAFIWGLTQGHMGYLVTPEEYDLGGYEACASLYGRDGGTFVASVIDEVVATLTPPAPTSDGQPQTDSGPSLESGDPSGADAVMAGDPIPTHPTPTATHADSGCGALSTSPTSLLLTSGLILMFGRRRNHRRSQALTERRPAGPVPS